MKLIGGTIFILAGAFAALFFERYRDFGRRVAGPNAGGSLPDRRLFVVTIRLFGALFIVAGGLMCWSYFH